VISLEVEVGEFSDFLVLVACIAVIIALGWYRSKKRREALARMAGERGWTLIPRDDSWAHRWDGPPFRAGDDRRAENILVGTHNGRQCVAFDYSYKIYSNDSHGRRRTNTVRYSVCSVAMPKALPPLTVFRDGFFGRLATALGGQDIQVGHKAFDRRYRVRAENPAFATDVLGPQTAQALLDAEAVAVRIDGRDILSWYGGPYPPREVDKRLAALTAVVDGIPGSAWKSHGLEA
jgi:hypothetical protein